MTDLVIFVYKEVFGQSCKVGNAHPTFTFFEIKQFPVILWHGVIFIEEEEVAQTLIMTLAEATEIKLQKTHINRTNILKKAEEFYFSNLKSFITTQDICQELKVSQRTLEYIFKDYYQMSPKKYFQRLRLNALNQELQQKEQQGNLGEIAEKFGFYHRGRLARDYHQLFGEVPSETLRG